MAVPARDRHVAQQALRLEEIGWPHSHAAFTVLTGLGPSSRAAFGRALAPAEAPTVGTLVVPVGEDAVFRTFAGANALLDELMRVARREAPELVEQGAALRPSLSPSAEGGGNEAAEKVADSITFAVTRRISRESHHSALVIDRFAQLVLDCARFCASFAQGLTILVPDAEHWDRASLKCLYRIAVLAEADVDLRIVLLAPRFQTEFKPTSLEERVTSARARFLERLTWAARATVVDLGADDLPRSWPAAPEEPFPRLLAETGAALAYQNYERVYLLCDRILRTEEGRFERAEARRLAAITHAQLGDLDAAQWELAEAAELADDPKLRAHIAYLRGLLATKRAYDLDLAMAHYRAGLRELDGLPDDPAVGLERAWLFNGEALVLTLRAKEAEPEEREQLFAEAFRHEFDAYALAKGLRSPAGSYLRYNLLANITFLLEIAGRYDEAVGFWRKAFERHLASENPGFKTMFEYRLGILLFRLGRSADAVETLENVRAYCRQREDPFYEERVCLAHGHVALAGGDDARAAAAFSDGAALAVRTRQQDAYGAQVAGLLCALAELGAEEEFDEVVAAAAVPDGGAPALAAALDAVADVDDRKALLDAAGIQQPVPSPKISPYVPSVDLEGSPDQDLNRVLVADDGAKTRRKEA